MALERIYNVPLRKEFMKAPKYKRAKKAVTALKQFLMKHMKSTDVKIGRRLNLAIWEKGIKNPPHHIKVNAFKDDSGIVKAELEGFDYKELTKEDKEKAAKKKPKKIEEKKEEPKEDKKKDKEEVKPEEPKKEEPKQEKAEDKKEEPKSSNSKK